MKSGKGAGFSSNVPSDSKQINFSQMDNSLAKEMAKMKKAEEKPPTPSRVTPRRTLGNILNTDKKSEEKKTLDNKPPLYVPGKRAPSENTRIGKSKTGFTSDISENQGSGFGRRASYN